MSLSVGIPTHPFSAGQSVAQSRQLFGDLGQHGPARLEFIPQFHTFSLYNFRTSHLQTRKQLKCVHKRQQKPYFTALLLSSKFSKFGNNFPFLFIGAVYTIDHNGAASKWGATPFSSDSIVLNEGYVTSVTCK